MASILEEIDTKLFNLLDIRIRPMTRGGEADKIGIVGFFSSTFFTDKSVLKGTVSRNEMDLAFGDING
jgi:hypothetical protein